MKHFLVGLNVLLSVALIVVVGYTWQNRSAADTIAVPVLTKSSAADSTYRTDAKRILAKLSTDVRALIRKNYSAHYAAFELRDIAEIAIGDLRKLDPPSDVSGTHYAVISALQYCVDAVNDRIDYMDDRESATVMSRCAEKINSIEFD